MPCYVTCDIVYSYSTSISFQSLLNCSNSLPCNKRQDCHWLALLSMFQLFLYPLFFINPPFWMYASQSIPGNCPASRDKSKGFGRFLLCFSSDVPAVNCFHPLPTLDTIDSSRYLFSHLFVSKFHFFRSLCSPRYLFHICIYGWWDALIPAVREYFFRRMWNWQNVVVIQNPCVRRPEEQSDGMAKK